VNKVVSLRTNWNKESFFSSFGPKRDKKNKNQSLETTKSWVQKSIFIPGKKVCGKTYVSSLRKELTKL
jgi:hypothetical protein